MKQAWGKRERKGEMKERDADSRGKGKAQEGQGLHGRGCEAGKGSLARKVMVTLKHTCAGNFLQEDRLSIQ